MVDHSTGGSVVMAKPAPAKVSGMAIDTLTTMGKTHGGTNAGPGTFGVAGLATISSMGLACADERRGGGSMTTDAVYGQRSSDTVDRDRSIMAVDVGVKIGGMTL